MSPLTEPTKLTLAKVSQPLDADAQAYVNAVEVADGQRIEDPVRFAINNFVIGCKADGIWTAIKASCILAGARTLAGALVPLVGTAPTNVGGLFVQADYNRKTGLVGNGSTKYLNSNRNNNADPQNSNHNSVYVSTAQVSTVGVYIGVGNAIGSNNIGQSDVEVFARNRSVTGSVIAGSALGFLGHSRAGSAAFSFRVNSANALLNVASETPSSDSITVFNRNLASFANARIAFYSIGESLNLALLDARVTDLINAFGAAIP